MPQAESTAYVLGFSWWKRRILPTFLPGVRLRFVRREKDIPSGQFVIVWGMREVAAAVAPSRLVRVEDGFLRSVGLGAELARPLSWVLDDHGVYFDATHPSGLERILQHHPFSEAERARGRTLRERIVASALTKYNVDHGTWERPAGAAHVVLVPGQVESDASLRYGCPGIRTNLELLQAARATAPDSYIVYKPHPDVVAGLRKGSEAERVAATVADEVVTAVPMHALLSAVDEVHVLTSLAGFEALLRGKVVRCEGLPFYAGWGLTLDTCQCARRNRKVTLDELTVGAIAMYPTYRSSRSGPCASAELALDELDRLIGLRKPWLTPKQLLMRWAMRLTQGYRRPRLSNCLKAK